MTCFEGLRERSKDLAEVGLGVVMLPFDLLS